MHWWCPMEWKVCWAVGVEATAPSLTQPTSAGASMKGNSEHAVWEYGHLVAFCTFPCHPAAGDAAVLRCLPVWPGLLRVLTRQSASRRQRVWTRAFLGLPMGWQTLLIELLLPFYSQLWANRKWVHLNVFSNPNQSVILYESVILLLLLGLWTGDVNITLMMCKVNTCHEFDFSLVSFTFLSTVAEKQMSMALLMLSTNDLWQSAAQCQKRSSCLCLWVQLQGSAYLVLPPINTWKAVPALSAWFAQPGFAGLTPTCFTWI